VSALQKPDATHVAGYRTWTSLGRFVRRGEKGILILAPMVGNKRKKDEAEQTEQDTDANETQGRCTVSAACMCSKDYLVICGRAFARSM
jgi:N-terminal domain of anti-restriction factor ArdC